jgi:hypothetical protein
MANAIQLRRGTTAEHSTFTGLVGEVTVDTTKDTIVVHDGATAGGVPLAKESDIPAALTASEILTSLAGVDGAGSGLDADTLDGKQLATIESEYQAYANSAAAAVVDAAPATLDTLNELAAALGDDPNFATTVTNSIATKMPIAGGTFTGNIIAPQYSGGLTDVIFNADVKEKTTVSATAATGTTQFDVLTQQVLFFTSNASGNFQVNIRGDASNTLNSLMEIGDSITLAFLVTNGGTAYYLIELSVDGSTVTPKWQGGTAPDAGNASSVDIYTFTVIKTGSAAFSVFASQTQFA